MLESRNGAAQAKEEMPFGQLYKKMENGKYVNVIDLRDDLRDSLVFPDALTADSTKTGQLKHKNQLRFEPVADDGGLHGVRVGQGTFRTFERLLNDNPAVVAGKGFVADTMRQLLDVTTYLHDQGIFHICYAPSNILARKNDHAPMLLFHGSAYQAMNGQQALYGEAAAAFVAPEVLDNGVMDERSDIYSLGQFMAYLYQQSEVPFELKGVIKKATDPVPEKRYQTPEQMRRAIDLRLSVRKVGIVLAAALIVAAVAVVIGFPATPEPENIEYVNPAQQEAEYDPLDKGFDALTELGLVEDTAANSPNDRKMREYNAKAEQIFRKRFTKEAEGILSKIYNNDRMGAVAKNFAAGSQSTMEELVRAQVKFGDEAGLNTSRSQLIASQIIEQVTNRLKAQMADKAKKAREDEERQKLEQRLRRQQDKAKKQAQEADAEEQTTAAGAAEQAQETTTDIIN